MKQIFSIKDISTYRSELMGWAIIWIMMLHFTFTQIKPLGFIAQYGFAGVEIFMTVSGLGLYFSLDKNSNIWIFYRKRVFRIFPTYYILGILASILLFHDNILNYLYRYSTVGFWTSGPYWEWFVPSIVVLYIIAPLLKKTIDNGRFIIIVSLSIIIYAVSYFIIANEIIEAKDPHFFLLYRIPAFMFGMVNAYWIKSNTSIKYYFLLLLIGLPCFALLFPHHHEIYNYKYFSLVFLLPLFLICFIIISKYIRFIIPIIATIGSASLEIYLIQAIFFHAINIGILDIAPTWHDIITIILIVMSSLFGIFVHWLFVRCRITKLL